MISPISPADILVMITGLTNMSIKRFTAIILITKPLHCWLWLSVGYRWGLYQDDLEYELKLLHLTQLYEVEYFYIH